MKKLLVLTALFILTVTINAQTFRLRATSAQAAESKESNWKYSGWSEWIDCSLVCTVDYDNMRLHIMNKWADDFLLNGSGEEIKMVDTDGDRYSRYVYNAVDQDGITCRIHTDIWEDINLVWISVYYPNCAYRYDCTLIN